MAYIEEVNELMTDATGQSIATAIGAMNATSVGNLSALTTTDKTSLVAAVNELNSDKQPKTDNNLTTTDKTTTGAINELKSGLTNLDNEVNGDAVEYPYADVITIPDAIPANLADCNVKIEPVQDLHGYDKPWVGGAGKNKLPLVLADIKAANTTGTWSGNVYTAGGGTIEILTDSDENIIGFKVDGTFTSNVSFTLWTKALAPYPFGNTRYIMNGCPSGGAEASVYKMDIIYRKNAADNVLLLDVGSGSGAIDFSVLDNNAENVNARIVVYAGTVSNKMFYPMIRLATEADATFAPYTNICPITGHTEASVERDGKNLCSGINDDYYINSTGTQVGKTAYNSGLIIDVSNFEKVTISTSEVQNRYRACMIDDVIEPNTTATPYNCVVKDGTSDSITISTNGRKYLVVNATRLDIIQVENGEVATPYVPYAGKTYTISLGDTIYGGSVDFDSGVMTVDREILDLDTASVNYGGQLGAFVVAETGKKSGIIGLLTNKLNIITTSFSWSDYSDYPDMSVGQSGGNNNLYFKILSANNSVSDFKTAMSDVQVIYELATPTTIQLTPQQIQLLKGTNTLTASTGQISVTVNGVSGSIGAVQEQVNDHEERIEEVKSGLTGLVGKLAGVFGTTLGTQSLNITFAGSGLARNTHYIVYVCGQIGPLQPIYVSFNGVGQGTPEQITSISIDHDLSGLATVNNNHLIINCSAGGGWGTVRIVDIVSGSNENITITAELVNN